MIHQTHINSVLYKGICTYIIYIRNSHVHVELLIGSSILYDHIFADSLDHLQVLCYHGDKELLLLVGKCISTGILLNFSKLVTFPTTHTGINRQ